MMKGLSKIILSAVALWLFAPAVMAANTDQPSFDCHLSQTDSSEVKQWVCGDGELSQLDRKLDYIYQQAQKKTALEDLPLLDHNQHQWAAERNACMTQKNAHACAMSSYQHRIAELQSRYLLVPSQGPFTFVCDNVPATWLVAQFFDSDPNVARAKVGNEEVMLTQVPSASGAKYQDDKHQLWNHGGELMLRWGKDAAEIHCHKKADGTGY
ncbi:MliC family protein [Shewanella yunxiaonensis]|uniref:MliC family protein n=1 Tax=Shewanella yunxiaonensis TaxID=2829809 RepID=A0ABX7YRW2_9GAMM|nr:MULTISPECIES: MliC family protein [Shewanella]MDF0534184.1 MliC family protein [Shewanella sp. A32]QUN05523.1 MliC family protein [Shewanella yunxiaonensis]